MPITRLAPPMRGAPVLDVSVVFGSMLHRSLFGTAHAPAAVPAVMAVQALPRAVVNAQGVACRGLQAAPRGYQ